MPDQEEGDKHISNDDAIVPTYHMNIYNGYLDRLPDNILDTDNLASTGKSIGTHRDIIVRKIKYYRDIIRGKLPF